jgi:hypothetical protein
MHSVPERKRKDDRRTRYEQYGPDHPYTAMPELDEHEYLAGLFIDTGMAAPAGMGGQVALSWAELQAFDHCGRLQLTGWELSRLMDMSRAYCQWLAKGGKQGDIADDVPYIDRTRSATGYLLRQRDASAANRDKLE